MERLRARGEARRRATLRDLLFTQLLGTVSYTTASLATGVILLVAGQSLQAGTLTVGDFALFLSYLAWLTQMTGFFGNFVTKIRQVGVSFDRAALVQDGARRGAPGRSPARNPAADRRQRLVRHGPVYLRGPPAPGAGAGTPARRRPAYAGGTGADLPSRQRAGGGGGAERSMGASARCGASGIDLTLRRGTLTVVTGRVGAGKSTLLRTLLGLLRPRRAGCSGTGSRCATGRPSSCPPRAYTPQTPRLFSESLEDNLLLGLDPTRSWRTSPGPAPGRAGGRRAVLPHRAGDPIGPRGAPLRGRAQRAACARMFVRRPELLVVDDLSSALDAATERELWVRLSAEPDGTCLAVSHRRGGPAPGRPGGRPGRGAGAGPGPPSPSCWRRAPRCVPCGRERRYGRRTSRETRSGRSLEWPDHEDGQNQHGQNGEDGLSMGTLTPLRRQYLALKQRHPDAILFFRLGTSTRPSTATPS